ncbi:subtilisin family serine protease [Kribbella sp. VKM Ac-2527]|uniref:Subtilisin family serine protease n=1 Tax=Kribbella caucasensis TaxID=2512215 RepID=A0A4R6K4V3_9ACTN|nr:S8 family serine peptidase [Kribbella sp. VKM Ac-2527]TDO44350.1 subtilisin family serine protease [Kribbella sp. VKM Ac-2527]
MRKALILLLSLCLASIGVLPSAAAPVRSEAGLRAYFVLTAPKQTAQVTAAITQNGGTVFATYDAVGVIVVHSTAADFAGRMRTVNGVQKVGATRTSDVPPAAANPAIPPAVTEQPNASPEISRSDMTQIGADKAWAINPGSKAITVGVLDTGVDDQHPDLKANFDATRSASCAYGKVDTRPGSWRPVGEHGTHVAGSIAAAKDGKGMVGVAPGVRISSIRVAEAGSQLFFPENTVCAFMFAADKGVSVTNNSYYTDPWLFVCPTDPDQDAIAEAVRRSVAYSDSKGVVNVAAAGNENYNLAEKSADDTSPNDSTPGPRNVSNDCLNLPGELPNVVVVASVDTDNLKSGFSNFGDNKITVAAPGEEVYSTIPGGGYQTLQGTSMASPHVAGVAALLRSVNPKLTAEQVRERLGGQANDLPCPAASGGECTGSDANNSYYGEGLVDAAEAVGVAGSTSGTGVTVTEPGEQLGFGGLPAIPLLIKGMSGKGGISYTATGLPPGLSIDHERGWIIGVLTPGAGRYKVTVTARDAEARTASASFFWNVWSF